ncbi:centromere/kinetochore protein zw10 homolog [Aspergillus udagawae]|uniref:Centromere/kinetochore protein zw10 homolog n=1 Tax=Aspergillus udagawae TaxID=91492 RepID=A0ABQ1A8T2_9EURO|nr:centromere/kinetochore protein zw10 homolog [Aspergillus udagawae]GFF76299.1 centromere/kinetochore protein zw10 homolog [Aspergillus udagawae]GFG03460.1 centromere/kinetochore protein zw10 homolog [Aspergillus udagawae]GFG23903.1 centromere/kinetochore protein zw10 homolog [Aspergillus udagawae]
MSPQASEQKIYQSVLDFVTEGTFPGSEDVVSSVFPTSALATELELISNAREQVEAEINSLSRENDFDADGWISQAKQLHADIERSRLTAREIVAQHENTRPLQLKVEDASAKVRLIQTEIAFNQAVTRTLEEVQGLCQRLSAGRTDLAEGRIMAAINTVNAVEDTVHKDSLFANTNVKHILVQNVAELRKQITEDLRCRWNNLLKVDREASSFEVAKNDCALLDDTIAAMARLDLLVPANDRLQKDLLLAIVDPILLPNLDGYSRLIRVAEGSIHVQPEPATTTAPQLLDRVSDVLGFLQQCLPSSISGSFSDTFIPALSSRIISSWLSSAVPTDLAGLTDFEAILESVLKFAQTIETLGWHGQEELVSWVNQAPRLWLTRRRADSLDQVRKVLAGSQGLTMQVERVEKEEVSQADEVLLENATSDDWDANWDDDNGDESKGIPSGTQEDDDDVAAWGLDDDAKEGIVETKADISESADDDDADAWGWGDDEDGGERVENQPPQETDKATPVIGGDIGHHASREVTLREHYTVTDIPDSIMAIVRQQVRDVEVISQPGHNHTRIVSSAAGLLALPTLILAMFKATAPSFYSLKLNAGQMYLYNDSLYLVEQLRTMVEEHKLSRLSSDLEALEKFGKLAYSKEMQTQRTIVTDLLDGAQGFSQCSEQPFLGECENAISATVDRIRDVYKEWQPILSHSALLQSIGSLVASVINKIIIDIEDLGDISEAQSQRLVSFCNQVSQLEDLFMPGPTEGIERVPMTAVYVRNWLKFQYLINILESSLADIRFLWTEGELRLEFSADEVVDLIKALFAESDYRRKAIADIRRQSRG